MLDHAWQRTGAVGEGGPAHPDSALRRVLQPAEMEDWKSLVAKKPVSTDGRLIHTFEPYLLLPPLKHTRTVPYLSRACLYTSFAQQCSAFL